MTTPKQEKLNDISINQAEPQLESTITETPTKLEQGSETGVLQNAAITDKSETKNAALGIISEQENRQPFHESSSLGPQISDSSNPSQAPDLHDDPAPTVSVSGGRSPSSATSAARLAPPGRKSDVRVSPTDDAASSDAVPTGLTSRISSLSAAAGASLRDMIANSNVVMGSPDLVIADDIGSSSGGREVEQSTRKESLPTGEGRASVSRTEPVTETGGTEGGVSADATTKDEHKVKREPPDFAEAPVGKVADDVPDAFLRTQESEAFTPTTALLSPERERQEYQTSNAAVIAPGSSASPSRRVKIVKEMAPPSGRRSSSYLYNDWDRTLYEKTGRPPPGEAHWSREKSSHNGRSPTRLSGTSARPHSRGSARPSARSPSAGRQQSRSRPATTPSHRRTYDMAGCQRETQDQFGRRILYRHCFIEPQFTLRGQRIPVHGARKGSIIAAEDTYAFYALELVPPPSEGWLSAQKMQRRRRVLKKRRRRRRRSPNGKSAKRERLLIEEQWQRLEEEGEKLEEDRTRLQNMRQHLEQLEEWWQTEGLLILQRNELRAQEEKIINAVIEEECLRINDERSRIRQQWQLLVERMTRQEEEEVRIREEISALDEKQEKLSQREETDNRRIHEMKAVFEIERRMMEVDRRLLVKDALTCDAFQDALKDAELAGCKSLPGETHRDTNVRLATGDEPTQPNIGDQIVNLEDSKLPSPEPRTTQHFSAPGVAEPVPASFKMEQRSPVPPEIDGDCQLSVDSDSARQQPLRPITARGRPITARGRPVRASRSTPSGDEMAHQMVRPLSATRSEGVGAFFTVVDTSSAGETVDVWRRRPTVLQRNEMSSLALVTEEDQLDSDREGSRTYASSRAFTIVDEPAQDKRVQGAHTGESQHAKSEGCVSRDAKGAAIESERRRVSATPRLETQEKRLSSVQVDKTVPPTSDNASGRSRAEPTASGDVPRVCSETVSHTHAASSEISSRQASDGTTPAVCEPDVENSAGSFSEAQLQTGSLRSGLQSRGASQRHVSFHGEGSDQSHSGGANSMVGDDDTGR